MTGQSGIKLFGKEWHILVSRNMSFWHQYISGDSHANDSNLFGIRSGLELVAVSELGARTHLFGYQKNIASYSESVLTAFSTAQKTIAMRSRYERFGKELLLATAEVVARLSLTTWKKFLSSYAKYATGLTITTMLGRKGQERLELLLKEHGVPETKIPETIGIITYPQRHTPLMRSQKDLLAIGAKIQRQKLSGTRQVQLLQGWLKKHGYIPVNFCDEPWTLTDAQEQLQKVIRVDCQQQLRALDEAHHQKKRQATQTLRRINNKTITTLSFALAEGTLLNEHRKNVFSKVSLMYRPVFAEIARRGGSPNWRDCFFLTPEEMTELVAGKTVGIGQLVQKRTIAGVATFQGKKPKLLKTSEAKRFLGSISAQKTEKKEQKHFTELRGFAASRGSVQGTVKVILGVNDFPKLRAGEILVTRMTSVDFIPVMERAAAFITDEGGVTSHASIVAREMNKPCIIGTKIATKVLRDGDLVEVDANKGIVRKLSKSGNTQA